MTGSDVVVGCVAEDNPKFLAQALRLVQSIRWFGGELAKSRIIVGCVETIDPGAKRALERFDAEVHVVPRFHPRSTSGNRLQWYELATGPEKILLSLDCDIIVTRDPIPMLRDDAFQAKIAPAPTVTHEVFERLFPHFGLALPERSHTTGYTFTPTIPYFNAGVTAMPVDIARELLPIWREYNIRLADEPHLVDPCAKHLHQAALALALAESGVPVMEMPASMNFQLNHTNLASPPGYEEMDPYLIHYHQFVDPDGFLMPTPLAGAQKRIDQFHKRLRDDRQQLVILGMHRSGTSVLARVLNAMGCYIGEPHDQPAVDVYNPTGYFERSDVVALNDALLATLDASWLDPAAIDATRFTGEVREQFLARAREVVRKLNAHGTWVMKDPRMSVLFPFWRELLESPVCVVASRDTNAVAKSLKARDGLPLQFGIDLSEQYRQSIEDVSRELPHVDVSYEDLIADPIATVAKLHRDLSEAGVRDLKLPSNDEIGALIDPSLDRRGGYAARFISPLEPLVPSSTEAPADHLLEAVFASRSWRIGFAITRMFRMFSQSDEASAEEKWRAGREKDARLRGS